jgi:sec-independent protein translocase protein TatA
MTSIFINEQEILLQPAGWFGPWEIAAIVVVVLLLFGGRKIPELMKGLGKGVKEFKEGIAEDDNKETGDNKETTEKK